jgi:hypothetical protein
MQRAALTVLTEPSTLKVSPLMPLPCPKSGRPFASHTRELSHRSQFGHREEGTQLDTFGGCHL